MKIRPTKNELDETAGITGGGSAGPGAAAPACMVPTLEPQFWTAAEIADIHEIQSVYQRYKLKSQKGCQFIP